LHRLDLEYHKPNFIPRKLDEDKQKAFIEDYDKTLNSLGNDEVVLFADAVHPTHAARSVGCWAPKQDKLAIEQTSGRERINIHGAINLESGQTRMIDVQTVDATSTITLLEAIEALYPLMMLIHVFLDNARYHHAKPVRQWLARPGCRIKLLGHGSRFGTIAPGRDCVHEEGYGDGGQNVDQHLLLGVGAFAAAFSVHSAACAVEAVKAWLAASGISEGPLFRPVAKGGRRVVMCGN
jgi:DDE superfamily endonuclease